MKKAFNNSFDHFNVLLRESICDSFLKCSIFPTAEGTGPWEKREAGSRWSSWWGRWWVHMFARYALLLTYFNYCPLPVKNTVICCHFLLYALSVIAYISAVCYVKFIEASQGIIDGFCDIIVCFTFVWGDYNKW